MPLIRVVVVFAIALSSFALAGCARQLPAAGGSTPAFDGNAAEYRAVARAKAKRTLYVVNTTPSITEYDADASGDASPINTIAGKHTHMGLSLISVVVDSQGVLYATREDGGIVEYAPGASGDATPLRVITAASNGPIDGSQLALDRADNLYVANQTDIKVFAPGAAGVATPIADIAGPATTIGLVTGVAVDAAGNVFAADFSNVAILEFAAGATGNVAPIATIAGPATTLSDPRYLGLSDKGDIYVSDESIAEIFAAGSDGNVAPARTITFTNGVGPGSNIALSGNEAFMGLFDEGPASIAVYKAGLKGSSKARRTITGQKTQLLEPQGIFVR